MDTKTRHPVTPEIVDVEVGTKIRSRRRELGITQQKLAERVGVTFQQIQKYEKGTNRVGASRLLQIATVLSVPASFFFNNEPHPSKNAEDAEQQHAFVELISFLETSDGVELNNAFAKVKSRSVRARLAALVKSIAESETENHCQKDRNGPIPE